MAQNSELLRRVEGKSKITRAGNRAQLVTAALKGELGQLTASGALSVTTGAFTGRSPKDKFIVRDALTETNVWWENAGSMTPAHFDLLLEDALAHAAGKELWVEELGAGADANFAMDITVITETPWHALFIRNLLRERPEAAKSHATILHVPSFKANPARHGTRTETVIALDMTRNIVIVGGTYYAGEIKKSVFSLMCFHGPLKNIFPMHCSANVGTDGSTALFFGLSGTGKTTLSADPLRPLIGDDEHLWSDNGVANIEGGCYAKTVKLSAENEPEIYAASQYFGSVLENVIIDKVTGKPDFDDISLTENTRAAYPLSALSAVVPTGVGPTPETVVFLTADAFGVLPPIARLTPQQASEHFLAGYTAKVAGTERGVATPTATFSACFGAPFMSHHPQVYGDLLKKRLEQSGAQVWLVNTGWIGGAYGVGRRIDLPSTRRLVHAALSGELDNAKFRVDPNFGFEVPLALSGISDQLLDPRANWRDPAAYDLAAQRLVAMFEENAKRLVREPATAAA